MYARHSVSDYDAWRRAYEDFDAERRELGVLGDGVYQSLDDPNDITIFHDFEDRQHAERFAGSERLAEVMKEAGVKSGPEIWFVHESEKPPPS